jgi:hypothetical protein
MSFCQREAKKPGKSRDGLIKVAPVSNEKFSQFSRNEISNPLMFHHNFEFGCGTLISLRSLALALTLWGRTG